MVNIEFYFDKTQVGQMAVALGCAEEMGSGYQRGKDGSLMGLTVPWGSWALKARICVSETFPQGLCSWFGHFLVVWSIRASSAHVPGRGVPSTVLRVSALLCWQVKDMWLGVCRFRTTLLGGGPLGLQLLCAAQPGTCCRSSATWRFCSCGLTS